MSLENVTPGLSVIEIGVTHTIGALDVPRNLHARFQRSRSSRVERQKQLSISFLLIGSCYLLQASPSDRVSTFLISAFSIDSAAPPPPTPTPILSVPPYSEVKSEIGPSLVL